MTELPTARPASPAEDEMSLLAQVTVLLRWRRRIIAFGMVGACLGLVAGLLSRRVYRSSATFLPQGSDVNAGAAGLALVASQFGIKMPMPGNTWGPPVYVALLHSRALLAPIATDTLV